MLRRILYKLSPLLLIISGTAFILGVYSLTPQLARADSATQTYHCESEDYAEVFPSGLTVWEERTSDTRASFECTDKIPISAGAGTHNAYEVTATCGDTATPQYEQILNSDKKTTGYFVGCSDGSHADVSQKDASVVPSASNQLTGIPANPGASCDLSRKVYEIPTWYQYLDGEADFQGICRPILNLKDNLQNSVVAVLLGVFEIIIFIAAIIAVAFVLVGGFQYMLSQGEAERSKNARTTIINALIGLAITLSATAIVKLIGQTL